MRTIRLYHHSPLSTSSSMTLDENTTHRLLHVLRVKPNQSLILFNGDGHEYTAQIEHIQKKIITIEILEKTSVSKESPIKLHLGQVIAKGEKMDTILQKATELGVCDITPLFSKRSIPIWDEKRLAKKMDHWQSIIIQASEQCGRCQIPTLYSPQDFQEWIAKRSETQKLILDPHTPSTTTQLNPTEPTVLTVGPEGGFTREETQLAQEQGFHSLSLGPRILRVETASLAAIVVLQHALGDMS